MENEKIEVLVVTDTQVDFESGSLGTKEAQASVPAIIRKITEMGNDGAIIIGTGDTHGKDYLETSEGKKLPVEHCIEKTPGWKMVPGIKEAFDLYGGILVMKDKFGSVDLASIIRVLASNRFGQLTGLGKKLRIVIIGWCTDICVIVNAILLKTAFPDAEIIVDSACCAGVTPEKHEAALEILRSCQIEVV